MNAIPKRHVALIWSSLILLALPMRAAVVTANFTSASTVPVTAAAYTATGNTVNFTLNFAPAVATTLTVVQNTGSSPIQGTFANLGQWQTVRLTYAGVTYPFVANYFGGTGNDLVLQWGNTRVLAWGYNVFGQLGNGTANTSLVPAPVSAAGVLAGQTIVATAAGNSHSLALCADGSLAAWGYNSNGQLGNNSTTNSIVPVLVDRSGLLAGKTVTAIAAGNAHSLALCADGTLAIWGSMGGSQAPVAVTRSGVLAGKAVIAIAAGDYHCLALCADGTLAAWGSNSYGQLGDGTTTDRNLPVLVTSAGILAGKTVQAVAAGTYHSLALCTDGTLAAWGYNTNGQLGNNSTTNSSVPVLVDRSGVLAGKAVTTIGSGSQFNLAGCADGTLAAWGYNSNGQLGNGNTTYRSAPVLVTQTGVLAGKTVMGMSGGGSHSLGLCASGELTAWGYNTYGQLGNNSTTSSSVPVWTNSTGMKSGERFIAAAGGTTFSLALTALPPPPAATTLAASAITDAGATLNASINPQGGPATVTFEYGLTTAYGTLVNAAPASVTGSTAAPASATISGLLSGTIYHYRVVATGDLGTTRGDDLTFTTTTFATLVELGLNPGTLSPALAGASTRYIATVPNGATTITVTPITTSPAATVTVNGRTVSSGTASAPISLAVGENTLTVAVTAADGINAKTYTVTVTRLPATFAFDSVTAVPLTVGDFLASGAAPDFALNFALPPVAVLTVVKITGTGAIRGSFTNLAQGQLVPLTYLGVTRYFIANYYGGSGNDLVLQPANTRLLAWGFNTYGELGNGSTTASSVPVPVDRSGVLAGRTIVAIVNGASHSVALCADGTLAAWGSGVPGQLGNGEATASPVPVAVDQSGVLAGKTVVSISSGMNHLLALCADGTVAAWGSNSYGELGNGSTTASPVPVLVNSAGVLAGKTVIAVAAGGTHSLALCADGTLAAWGYGGNGRLGSNSTSNSKVPVAVDQTGVLAGKTVVAIAAGGGHNLALCSDGTLAAWGYNANSELGNNLNTDSLAPILVDRSGVLASRTVTSIAAGDMHSLALCSDGTVAAWGDNSYGQVGTLTPGYVPDLVDRSGALAGKTVVCIATGRLHSLAVCSDGTMVAWGYNNYGQLGNNSTVNSVVPVTVDRSALRDGESFIMGGRGQEGDFSLGLVSSPMPTAATLPASDIAGTTAMLNGSVNANGNATTVAFEFGLGETYGTTLVADPAALSGGGATPVSAMINGLLHGTTYHYRVVAAYQGWLFRGADVTFTTLDDGDGYDNLIEYAFNLSPANGAGSPFSISPSTVSTGRVELSFTRPVGATSTVTYYLEYSSALGPATSWVSIPLTTINPRNITITPLNPGLETVTIRNLEAREGFVRFRTELDANGDQIIDKISYTGVEGWTESAMELGTRTYNNPYQHEAVFTGTVDATAGVSGQTLNFVTSAGTVNLATLLIPGASYYTEVTAGPNEGQRFDVVSATGSALTLATVSDVCSDTPPFNTLAGVLPATLAGNRIAIHRHWTLGELFPITRFFAADIQTEADQVQTSAVAATSTYWLYANGGQPKWVKLGDATLADQSTTVIAPGHGMFVTKRSIGAPLLACGEVRANNFIRPLCSGLNLVGGGYPVVQSATGTGSRQMDVGHGFFGSLDPATADMFSVWQGDATPGATAYNNYYLYNPGTAPKWVKTGDSTLAAHDADLLFLGDRSVLVKVKNDVHGYTIPNQSLVPALIAATPQAATLPGLAASGSAQDAASALIAYAFGLDPAGNNPGQLPQAQLKDHSYVIEFTQPAGVTNITYGAECSATLLPGSWTEVPDSGTGSEHIFSVPVAGGQLFMRLKVTGR